MKKLVFKQPITDSAKLKFLEFYCNSRNDIRADRIIDKYNVILDRGFIDISGTYETYQLKLKALDIWQEPEIEIGTPCKFWDYDEDLFTIAYYGGFNERSNHTANFINGSFRSDWKHCEPITEIPKYKGEV